MIEISYKHVRSGFFMQAFDRLTNNPNLPQKTSYNVSKIAQKLAPQIEKAQEAFMEIVKKYAIVDAKGNFVPDPQRGPSSFTVSKEQEAEYKAKIDEFDAGMMTVDRPKILVSELENVKLAPNEYLGLEPLLQEGADVLPLGAKQQASATKPSA